MSRIGKKPIPIPSGVKVAVNGGVVNVEGPKGKLNFKPRSQISVTVKDQLIEVSRKSDDRFSKSLHGLVRSLLNNMIQGVVQGYEKQLHIEGIGYRANMQGRDLNLSVGFSNIIKVKILEGVTVEVPEQSKIIVRGLDKQKVGQVAAEIRAVRPPEPYKGKGIRYADEVVKRKAGKTFAGTGS